MTTLVAAELTAPPVAAAPAPAMPATAQDKGLRAGALGLLSSVVIAVSSTAPAYSMAATLGLIVAVVGVHSPGTLIFSFLPMLCIAYAFRELNKADPDCGTTFTWTARDRPDRRGRRRAQPGHADLLVPADAVHRLRVPRAEQGRSGLRHHVHLDGPRSA